MTRLETLERWAYRVALISSLVAAARLGWALTRLDSQGVAAPETRELAHRSVHAAPDLSSLAALPKTGLQMATPEAINSAIAAAVGSATPMSSSNDKHASTRPEIISSYLSVQAGPPRSELRVNGSLVGKTPFLGQISCERGQSVRLDILPPKGLPSHYEIPCLAGEMRLRDEP